MIWKDDVSFEGFLNKISDWYKSNKEYFIVGDPPIEAQYALNLIFKTLIDDKANIEYLTTIPESIEQTNCIMLEMILSKYSRKYRRFKRKARRKSKFVK